jgi:chromosomal replication initiator protein
VAAGEFARQTQQELNEVLDALITSGKRVVLTANKPPRELTGIDEEIRSRMSSGLVTTIQEPDLSTRTRIIKRKAELQNIPLRDEFVDYLARRVTGDVRRIESAIIAISARAGLKDGRIDDKMIEEVVSCLVGSAPELSARSICDLVSRQFNVSLGDMRSKSRKKVIAFPRQVAMYLSRKHTEETLADIGRIFNRDHSTVMHSIKVVTSLSRRDSSVSAQLELLSRKVRQL